MHRSAYALVRRDFRELREKGLEGISAFPMSEDMMKWKADIEGLQNSIWQGLAFDVEINFTPDYNLVPPAVRFVTIPFHPNVDPDTGEPCIDFLNNSDEWDPTYTLSSILLALQAMLSNPVMENPVNLEAAQMLNEDPYVYQIVLQRLFQRSLPPADSYPVFPTYSQELVSTEDRTQDHANARFAFSGKLVSRMGSVSRSAEDLDQQGGLTGVPLPVWKVLCQRATAASPQHGVPKAHGQLEPGWSAALPAWWLQNGTGTQLLGGYQCPLRRVSCAEYLRWSPG